LNSAGRRVIEDGGTARDIVAFGLSENFLSEFAFTGVDGNCAIISFVINSLGHGDGLENDNFYSIALPMSAPFKLLLLRANSLNQGFLSSNRSRVNAVRVVHHSGK
jgi:hypothetical protein